MLRTSGPSRAVTIGGGAVMVAALAVLLTLHAREFTHDDWGVVLLGSAAIGCVASYALPLRGLRTRRSGLSAEAIIIDLPIIASLVELGGAVGFIASALAIAGGYIIACVARRFGAQTDLARHGVMRALFVLALMPLANADQWSHTLPPQTSAMYYIGVLAGIVLVFRFGISAALSAITYGVPLRRIWDRMARDPRTWAIFVAMIVWSAVARAPFISGNLYFGALLWMPILVSALLLYVIDQQHAELHRLRLVRDAVQAMLGDRDPLPQINAILATLRVPAYNETVAVLAATGARIETWRTVTTLGPNLSSAGDELRRRVLARLKFSGSASTSLTDDYYCAYAFASTGHDGEVHGAIVVHRRHDKPLTQEQMAQIGNAATELSPLLRDMKTIAATQSAATIDPLTGLFNRAATMERLQAMLESIHAAAEVGSVLLIDIDHFKTINDQLGHAAGDDVLRKFGDVMRQTVRGGDIAGRVGGEEFLVVMPSATSETALTVGERVRLAVNFGGMRYASGEPVTASIGVASARIGDTAETLLARADRGLYEAKRLGRNRIIEDLESA